MSGRRTYYVDFIDDRGARWFGITFANKSGATAFAKLMIRLGMTGVVADDSDGNIFIGERA